MKHFNERLAHLAGAKIEVMNGDWECVDVITWCTDFKYRVAPDSPIKSNPHPHAELLVIAANDKDARFVSSTFVSENGMPAHELGYIADILNNPHIDNWKLYEAPKEPVWEWQWNWRYKDKYNVMGCTPPRTDAEHSTLIGDYPTHEYERIESSKRERK